MKSIFRVLGDFLEPRDGVAQALADTFTSPLSYTLWTTSRSNTATPNFNCSTFAFANSIEPRTSPIDYDTNGNMQINRHQPSHKTIPTVERRASSRHKCYLNDPCPTISEVTMHKETSSGLSELSANSQLSELSELEETSSEVSKDDETSSEVSKDDETSSEVSGHDRGLLVCSSGCAWKGVKTTDWEAHERSHGRKPWLCTCGKRFNRKNGLRVHRANHPFLEPDCEFVAARPNLLQSHITEKHTTHSGFVCNLDGCGSVFPSEKKLKDHQTLTKLHSATNNKPFRCDWDGCIKSFENKKALMEHQSSTKRHRKRWEKSRKYRFICGLGGCQMRFNTNTMLWIHQFQDGSHEVARTNSNPSVAPPQETENGKGIEGDAGRISTSGGNLETQGHPIRKRKAGRPVGPAKKRQKPNDKDTSNSDTDIQPRLEAATRGNLDKMPVEELVLLLGDALEHIRSQHTFLKGILRENEAQKEKIFNLQSRVKGAAQASNICRGCGEEFNNSRARLMHERKVHTNVKKFFCSFSGCDKKFRDSVARMRHEWTHTGEKRYSCRLEECAKKFREVGTRTRHEKTQHTEVPRRLLGQLEQFKDRRIPFKVGRSWIHGQGLIAKKEILGDVIVLEYEGERITPDEAEIREAGYLEEGIKESFLYGVDENQVIDATKIDCYAKFINHHCNPNCKSGIAVINGEKKILIYTLRRIAPGEELLMQYNMAPAKEEKDRIPCLGDCDKCDGFIN